MSVDRAVHRELAVELFNHAWTLLEKEARTPEDDDEMIHAAHASRHHWAHAGTLLNLGRGEWQLSRVYATLGRAEPALYHGRRCLAYLERAEAEDWDVPYAYEALARAHLVGGDREEARRYADLAREQGARIADAEDRDLLFADLDGLARLAGWPAT